MHYDHSEESLKNVIKSKTHTFRVEIRRKNIGETLNTKRCKHIEETSTEANGPELFLEEPVFSLLLKKIFIDCVILRNRLSIKFILNFI